MTKIPLILCLFLAGCDHDRPPAPTSKQSAQLDEAEAMLNEMAANEERAAPEGTAPSNSEF